MSGDGWAAYAARNRQAWDEIADERAAWRRESGWTAAYFRDGGVKLPDGVRNAVGDVDGRSLLHLQCATGEESLSWVVLGARVTAVDISPRQIEIARRTAQDAGLDVEFVACDVVDVPRRLAGRRFEIVYTATGVLVWIPDLVRWASTVAAMLGPGGRMVLIDEHPVAMCLSGDGTGLRVTEDYFGRDQPIQSQGWTHFPGAEHATRPKAEFVWPLGDVVTALVEAGLHIVALREAPAGAYWRFGPAAVVARRLPGSYLLVADKLD